MNAKQKDMLVNALEMISQMLLQNYGDEAVLEITGEGSVNIRDDGGSDVECGCTVHRAVTRLEEDDHE